MAVRNAAQTWMQKGVSRTVWTGLLNGDTGSPESGAQLSDKSVQVVGTVGAGGSVSIQGSNDLVNWNILTDPQGNLLTFTTQPALEQIQENPFYIRPIVTAGDGTTNFSVTLISKGAH